MRTYCSNSPTNSYLAAGAGARGVAGTSGTRGTAGDTGTVTVVLVVVVVEAPGPHIAAFQTLAKATAHTPTIGIVLIDEPTISAIPLAATPTSPVSPVSPQ